MEVAAEQLAYPPKSDKRTEVTQLAHLHAYDAVQDKDYVCLVYKDKNTIESINVITEMTSQIASAAEQQSSVAEEINQNVTNISQVSEQTAAGANQTASSSAELAQLAESLDVLISQFRVA